MLCPEERRKEVQRSFRPQDDDTVPELKIRIAYGYETFWDLLEDMVRNTLPRYSLFANLARGFSNKMGVGQDRGHIRACGCYGTTLQLDR